MTQDTSTRLITRAAYLEMENSREHCARSRAAREAILAVIYRELHERGVRDAEDLAGALWTRWAGCGDPMVAA